MYETYFSLRDRPFAAAPRPNFYFPAPAVEEARGNLFRSLHRAEGIGLVVGPPGTGKSLLCHLLARQLRAAFQVALLSMGHIASPKALLQALCYSLGLPFRGMDEGELRLTLVDHVTLSEDCPRGMVVILDDADRLPPRLLDEAWGLTNLVRDGQAAVRLALAGGRCLEEHLARPRLESFVQCITARCFLEPLHRDETQQYIHRLLEIAGGRGEEVFPPDTCDRVHKLTEGVPRIVNQICDHAMLLAYASGCRCVSAPLIDEAWADLQQLPAPRSDTERAGEGGAVEFGHLEEEPVQASENDAPPCAEDGGPVLRISPATEPAPSEIQTDEQFHHIRQMLLDVRDEFPTHATATAEAGPAEDTILAVQMVADPADDQSCAASPPQREFAQLFARFARE
jgi:general secretion pathway protein A